MSSLEGACHQHTTGTFFIDVTMRRRISHAHLRCAGYAARLSGTLADSEMTRSSEHTRAISSLVVVGMVATGCRSYAMRHCATEDRFPYDSLEGRGILALRKAKWPRSARTQTPAGRGEAEEDHGERRRQNRRPAAIRSWRSGV